MPGLGQWLIYTFLIAPLWTRGVHGAADNTTCASSQLDWYTDAVGETPCITYQRLRQICNNDYQVQKFRSLTPGDNCDDQVSSCCCNSIAWSLSMLCMNCQYDTTSGASGIDAGEGAYQLYLGSCLSRAVNQTLPNDIQSAVCNKQIKIDRSLYSLFWNTGAWFYIFTEETIVSDLAATNNNTFTHCASTTVNETTTTTSKSGDTTSTKSSTSHNPESSNSKSGSNTGAIVGGAVGGTLGAIALGLVGFWLWRQRRRTRGPTPLDLSGEYRYTDEGDPQMGAVTPFSATTTQGPSSRYGGNTGYGGEEPESIALLPRSGPESSFGGSASGSGSGSGSESAFGLAGAGLAGAAARPSKLAGRNGFPLSPPAIDEDAERHEDGGPVPSLQRSASGRLPPAYRSWDEEPSDGGLMSPPASQWGGSSVSAGPSGSSASGPSEPRRLPPPPSQPQYPMDAKRPIEPS